MMKLIFSSRKVYSICDKILNLNNKFLPGFCIQNLWIWYSKIEQNSVKFHSLEYHLNWGDLSPFVQPCANAPFENRDPYFGVFPATGIG